MCPVTLEKTSTIWRIELDEAPECWNVENVDGRNKEGKKHRLQKVGPGSGIYSAYPKLRSELEDYSSNLYSEARRPQNLFTKNTHNSRQEFRASAMSLLVDLHE